MTQKSVSIRAIVSIRGVTIRAYTVVVFKLFNKTKTKKLKHKCYFWPLCGHPRKKWLSSKETELNLGRWYGIRKTASKLISAPQIREVSSRTCSSASYRPELEKCIHLKSQTFLNSKSSKQNWKSVLQKLLKISDCWISDSDNIESHKITKLSLFKILISFLNFWLKSPIFNVLRFIFYNFDGPKYDGVCSKPPKTFTRSIFYWWLMMLVTIMIVLFAIVVAVLLVRKPCCA